MKIIDCLDDRISYGSERQDESMKSLKGTKNIGNSDSWFRDTPHYWADASLPLAYAVACVEVVYRNSEKARILYNLLEARVYYHWTNIGMFVQRCV
jgi:hypothetical protein